ncbi:MAG TPA: hypothetical protein VLS89_03315 [Candidatus Nanopelagicales bacterium]|nr:hypothetical protein [Candidatus Nanopelagicales bacterium]
MRRYLSVASLTALSALLATGAASAAEWHVVRDAAAPAKAASPRAVAEGYLATAAQDLKIEGVTLAFHKELAASAFRTVRFGQTHAGLPVLGGGVAVRLGADGRPRVAVVGVARGLSVDPTPAFDEASAIAIAEAELGETLSVEPRVELAIQPLSDGAGRLVYTVDVLQASLRARRYVIDAHQGKVVRWMPTNVHAVGRVYADSAQSANDTDDVTLNELVPSTPQRLSGWNGNLTVTNYSGGDPYQGTMTVEQSLGPSSGEDFLYNPPANPSSSTDAIAQVSLYHHLTRAQEYFTNNLSVDMTPASWQLTAVANAISPQQGYLDNAFFSQEGITGTYESPNLIAIGQGSQIDFAVDSDVFIHEFGHYVSHNAIGYNAGQFAFGPYGLTPWGGGIDEGISDYFACTMNGDALLGETSLAEYARDLANTAKRCPDDVVGQVHSDGEIIGSLGWTLRDAFGIVRGDELVWGAMTLLMQDTTLGDFAKGLQETADSLVTQGQMTAQERTQLDSFIAQRGLDDCDNVLEVSPTKPRSTISMGLDFLGSFFGASCGQAQQFGIGLHSMFHFRVTPEPGDTSLRFEVDFEPFGGGALNWGIHVRAGEAVQISDETILPINATWRVENLNGTTGELVIDANSTPPFDPNQTYYMVIGDQSCPPSRMTVRTSIESQGTGGGGGGGGGDPGAGGAPTKGDDAVEEPQSCL